MTNLLIDEQAQERLRRHLSVGDQLILDFDDGVGPYSAVGVCSLDVSFRLLIVSEVDTQTYDQTVTSPLGPVAVKGYMHTYLEGHPRLTLNHFGLLSLQNDSGLIDSNVEIVDHPAVVAASRLH